MEGIEGDISVASENYLETIFELTEGSEGVRNVDVANKMNVSKASVNKAIGVLKNAGMVEQAPYGAITLTGEGYKRAKEVMSRHLTIQEFFVDILGIDAKTANDDACRIEHVVSEKTMKKWSEYLNIVLQKKPK